MKSMKLCLYFFVVLINTLFQNTLLKQQFMRSCFQVLYRGQLDRFQFVEHGSPLIQESPVDHDTELSLTRMTENLQQHIYVITFCRTFPWRLIFNVWSVGKSSCDRYNNNNLNAVLEKVSQNLIVDRTTGSSLR